MFLSCTACREEPHHCKLWVGSFCKTLALKRWQGKPGKSQGIVTSSLRRLA